MAITNTWAVIQMDCYPEYDNEQDVVFNVHWTLTADDGTYRGIVRGVQTLPLDGGAPFTPFADLTEEQVLGWTLEAMGPETVAGYVANVAAQIADQRNPPVTNPPLPWGS